MTSPGSADQPSRLPFDDTFIGRTLSGKWRIEKKLGAGGMGTVFLATDLTVDRPVALKFLLPAIAAETEYRARFEQEARVMAKVDHPNLVTLYGVERDGEVPFLVMKYVTGRTLAQLIKEESRVPLLQAMPLIKQMGSALTALHSQGYVHRDLKPGNVIVSPDGQVTLLDFGLARSHGVGLTRPGVALGSPFYMSPEQALADTVDARSDLYTFAVLVTELLTGKRPFREGDAHASLLAHLEKAPTPPHELDPAVPRSVSEVLLRALAKKPVERQQTVAQFMNELSEAAAVAATMVARPPVKKGDSGKQRPVAPVEDDDELTRAESPNAPLRRGSWDDDEQTVSARTRARRDAEVAGRSPTDVSVPVVSAPEITPVQAVAKRTLVETPAAQPTHDSARTLVGLATVNESSQQTLSAVSDVTPASTSDSASTIAAINPVESTDPHAPITAHTVQQLDLVKGRPMRTLLQETPALVYVGIGAGAVLIIALTLWILLG